ncbi:MAG: S-layer homology domain-containing protein [Acidimicrobiales bacterium]
MQHKALTILAVLASLAVTLVLSTPPASAASTWYVSASGSGSDCSSAKPCGSFEAALGKARPGDTVLVRAGSYPLQTIDRSVSWGASASNITFRPTGGKVTVGGIRSHVPSLTFRGFNNSGVMYFHAGADGNQAVGNIIEQAYVTSANGTVWRGNIIDPSTDGPDAMQVKGVAGDNPQGVTIVGNIFGPQYLSGDSHTDCLQIMGGDDVYVAGNTFFPCADKAMQIRSAAGGTVGSVTIEGNFISECAPRRTLCNGYHAVIVAAEGNDIRFIHNSVNGSMAFSESGSKSGGAGNVQFYGNIADSLPCTSQTDYNLVASGRCGSHDQIGTPTWVNPAELVQDLHLVAGSRGIGAGSPYAPDVDIDGQTNCGGGDLGADQTCGTAAAGGSNPSPSTPAPSSELAAAVAWLHEVDVTTEGPSAQAFGYLDTTTRAHATTFLFRAFGEPSARGDRLADVPGASWYTDAVQWGVAEEILTGYPNGTFRPSWAISRGDFALVLWRAAGSPSSSTGSLSDVSAGAYYADAIAWAQSADVMNGFNDGTFRPNDPITRGHAALMLCRFSNEVNLSVGRCG